MNPKPTIKRNRTAAHWRCMRRSNMWSTIRGEEFFHRRGNFHDVCRDCEMTCIQELDLCIRQVFSKRLGSGGNKERIILAPDRKQWRLRLTKIFLKFRI